MEFIPLLILAALSLVGFVAIFFTSFGTFIIVVGCVIFSLMTQFTIINIWTLGLIIVLYVIGELLEYLMVVWGAKKWGASNAAILGALLGGVIGAIIGAMGFIGGLILGTFVGIFSGAFVVELLIGKDVKQSLKAGVGGVLGRVGAIVLKVGIAFCIFLLVIYSMVKV